MSGYKGDNYQASRDRSVRGGYQGQHFRKDYHQNSHRDDRSVSFNTDERTAAAGRYNSTYTPRDGYAERGPRGPERAPFSDRDRTSGVNSPLDSRDARRPDSLDMSRVRDQSRPGSPLATPAMTSAGGFSAGGFSAGGQTPLSARPSSSSGEKLVDELRHMMRVVSHNYMLERERDAAKRNYDNTLKIYKETMSMKEAYPTSENLARQDRDEAQATLDRLEHELREAEARFNAQKLARYLEDLVPAAAAAKPSVGLQDELARSKSQIESMNAQIKNLVARLNDNEADAKKAEQSARSAMGQASKQGNRIDEVSQRQSHSMTYIGKLPEIEKKVNELVAAAAAAKPPAPGGADPGQVELLRKRVVGLEGQMSTVMSNQKGLEGKVAAVAPSGPGKSNSRGATPSSSEIRELTTRVAKLEESQQSQEAQVQVFSEKLGATESSLHEVANVQKRVDKDLQLMNQNMESFDEDVFKLSQQVDALQSAGTGSPSSKPSRPADPGAMDVDTALTGTPRRAPHPLSEKAEAVRKELKVSPAVFEALGEIPAKLTGLLGMKEYLAEAQGEALDQLQSEFDQQLNHLRDGILPRIQALDEKEKDLESKHSKLQSDHESLYNQTTALAALPQPAVKEAASPSSDLQNNPPSAVLEDLSNKIDEVDHKYGILFRGHDIRMQNTRTDALAHQILGSLQSAYPNLANTDEAIRQWVIARGNIEKQIADLKKTSDKVREVVNAQGLEVQAGKKTRIEVEELARELRERVGGAGGGNSGEGNFGGSSGGGDTKGNPADFEEAKKSILELWEGSVQNNAKVATTQNQLQEIKKDIHRLHNDLDAVKQTAEDAKKSVQRTKLDVNDKLRAFDIQLQDFREKITLEDDETLQDRLATLSEYRRSLSEEMEELRERFRSVLGKRSASQATSPNDSDAPLMGNGERKRKKSRQGKKKTIGAFIADDDDEDPYE